MQWTTALQDFLNLPLSKVLLELSAALEGKSTPTIEQWLASQPAKQQKKDQRVHPSREQGGVDRYDVKVLLTYLNTFVRK
jgi:hypothetical protein